ncbi:hypothetical protein TSUD_249190 [Trifolium subterraneum]|nr:hypothetical protein TSUD_249190 [Trifolium subterraneum]
MDMFRRNFLLMDHSYYNDTSVILHRITTPPHSPELYSLFGERFENMVKLDWPTPLEYTNFHPCGSASVNGILCMEGMKIGSIWDKRVVFWNPATREYKVTPPSPFAFVSPYWDPSICIHGFGYDQFNDDHKVIRHIKFYMDEWETSDDEPPEDLWEIYCLKSNKWRKLDLNMPREYCSSVGVQVYTDGVCHWWGDHDYESGINDKDYLVSFDLNNETFVKTSLPSKHYIDSATAYMFRHLNMLNGSIGLISYYSKTSIFHISILGEVGIKESWVKLFIVGPSPCVDRPIGIGKKGDIFFCKNDDGLVWFNLNTQKTEELGLKGGDSFRTMIYKESLLPFERIND